MQEPNPLSPWQSWSLDVQNKLKSQHAQIVKLETQLADLCEQIKRLEARPTTHIDNIAYHFDQLKVEKLDGTLNIGMTTPGSGDQSFPGSIEQLTVAKPEVFPSAQPAITQQTGPYSDIYANMNQYLDTQATKKLQSYEEQLSIPLDPYHRRIIIEDVRKQLPTRIEYYMQQANNESSNTSAGYSPMSLCDLVVSKTTRDTDAALLAYMKRLQSGNTQ